MTFAPLRDARLAIMSGDAQLAEEILTGFRETVGFAPRSAAEKRQIADELDRIRTLCMAMREGIALARQQVRELLGASRRLETYDRSGSRMIGTAGPSEVGRF